MFDAQGAFKKQFSPFEDGYIFYPSSKSGAKFISSQEYEQLIDGWQHTSGRAGTWKNVAIVISALVVWQVVKSYFEPPSWVDTVVLTTLLFAIAARVIWASFAPRRLVKDRKPVGPPRSVAKARAEARSVLSWPLIITVSVVSGAIFGGHLAHQDTSFTWWAWTIGSGLMCAAYFWIGIGKLRDR